jgi:hypothetical protein
MAKISCRPQSPKGYFARKMQKVARKACKMGVLGSKIARILQISQMKEKLSAVT